MNSSRVAVVTGASAGIGEAAALRLAEEGFHVIVGARRKERVEKVAAECGGVAMTLDVTDSASIESFCRQIDGCHVLVNNAGLALGLDHLKEIDDDHVTAMFETNVLGLVRMTRSMLPKLESSGNGHIVNVGSISGFEVYPGGGGYTASKHAVRAITKTLRIELLGKPIRVTEVMPGAVRTEFTLVRFSGDEDAAETPYRGIVPLAAADVADCIAWAVTRPIHVNIDEIVVRPRAQASATLFARDDD
ncbi:MAG TPA: SDR family NAD(P)-dependent oxidoreductase [Actinomycetota bacterium]|nr:SDR family NAD(P)-dependent oxidoreductase [Actinomycetota bacterium]